MQPFAWLSGSHIEQLESLYPFQRSDNDTWLEGRERHAQPIRECLNPEYFADMNQKVCKAKFTESTVCTRDGECSDSKGLVCSGGTCQCKNPVYKYNNTSTFFKLFELNITRTYILWLDSGRLMRMFARRRKRVAKYVLVISNAWQKLASAVLQEHASALYLSKIY